MSAGDEASAGQGPTTSSRCSNSSHSGLPLIGWTAHRARVSSGADDDAHARATTHLSHTHCHVNHAMRNLGAATACLWPNHASHRRSNGSKARPHLAFALVRRYEGQRRLERALLEQRRQGDFRAQRRSGLIPTKQAKAAALRINLYRKNRTTHTACLASSVAEERRGERHSPQTRKPQSGAKTRSA